MATNELIRRLFEQRNVSRSETLVSFECHHLLATNLPLLHPISFPMFSLPLSNLSTYSILPSTERIKAVDETCR